MSGELTREQVQALEELLTKITPGPWTYELSTSICSGYEYKNHKHVATWIAEIDHDNQNDLINEGCGDYSPSADANANLIAQAPNLAAQVIALHAENAALSAELVALRAQAQAVALERDELKAQIEHMETLKDEAQWGNEWAPAPEYRQSVMDVPPYMYSWRELDQLMSQYMDATREDLEWLQKGSITAEKFLKDRAHGINLYRTMVRTLYRAQTRPAGASAEPFRKGQRVTMLVDINDVPDDNHTPIGVHFVGTATWAGFWPESLRAAIQAAAQASAPAEGPEAGA